MTISKYLIGVAAVAILGAGGYGGYKRITGSGDSEGDDATGSDAERPEVSANAAFSTDIGIPVAGAVAVRDTLIVSVSAAAQAAAIKQSRLLAQVQGPITRIHVKENDRVGGGRLLIEIDPTEYELNLADAEAGLAQAQASYQEFTLFDDQITDPEVRAERDRVARARSGLDQAEVAVDRARLELTRTDIRAPFRGRAASIRVVEGEFARVGDELLTVVDLDPIKVEVQVLEGEVGYLSPGRKASVSFSAFPGETFVGTIETVNPVVEQQTRTARVTVLVPNAEGRILPGMYARVSLEAQTFADRLLVPRAAILERDRRAMLFVFEGEGSEGLAKWRYVTTGLMNDSLVELVPNPDTDMVEPGEVVLVDGHYTLTHDAPIRLVADVKAAGGRPQ
ncbi:MAG: efflux RND transporter periplasmic adaptor subunit [Gemmatimonadota bacterium]|nr:MAG: efflux RND transporter periplasmic adaptor subunit [Gemmatimonadota bacterium]